MRSIKIKDIDGHLTVTHPRSPLGILTPGRLIVREVTDIPDGVGADEVVRLLDQTCDVTWVGAWPGRFIFGFAELGAGRLIRS